MSVEKIGFQSRVDDLGIGWYGALRVFVPNLWHDASTLDVNNRLGSVI